MAKKKIQTDGHGNATNNPEIKYKSKPKPWKEGQFVRDYRLARNRVLYKIYPEIRQSLIEQTNEMKESWRRQDLR